MQARFDDTCTRAVTAETLNCTKCAIGIIISEPFLINKQAGAVAHPNIMLTSPVKVFFSALVPIFSLLL